MEATKMSRVPVKWAYESDIVDDKKTLRDYEGAGDPVPVIELSALRKWLEDERELSIKNGEEGYVSILSLTLQATLAERECVIQQQEATIRGYRHSVDIMGRNHDDRKAERDTARQDSARLREALGKEINTSRFESAPCYLCGYNGKLYFQPSTHPCAEWYHIAKQRALKGGAALTASRPDCATAEQVEQYIKMADMELGPDSSLPWVKDIRQFLRTRYTTR